MIELDGSQKSGSGTIVRYAVGLASLLQKTLHLTKIRAKRKKPGLQPQHLKAIAACSEMTGGRIKGATVKSLEITYYPGKKIKPGNFVWDIGTAGSTTLLAQTILPLACFASAPSHIRIIGGLFQDFAPAAHHLQYVVLPLLHNMGFNVELKIIRPGYTPIGNGVIELITHPVKNKLKSFTLDHQGKIIALKGVALASHLQQRKVSERMIESCNQVLEKRGFHAEIDCIYDTTATQRGASLTVYALTDSGCIIGADLAGRLGRTSEYIGKRVANMLLTDIESGATVDRHTADQLILYAALASGTTTYIVPQMTEHIETNVWLVESLLGAKVEYENKKLTIHGVSFKI